MKIWWWFAPISFRMLLKILFWTKIGTPRFVERGRRKLAMLQQRPPNPEIWNIVIPVFDNVTASILLLFAAFFSCMWWQSISWIANFWLTTPYTTFPSISGFIPSKYSGCYMSYKPVFRNRTFVIMLIFLFLVLRAFMTYCTTVRCSANAVFSLKQRKRIFMRVPNISSFIMCVYMEHLDSRWMDFHVIWYLIIFRISLEKVIFH